MQAKVPSRNKIMGLIGDIASEIKVLVRENLNMCRLISLTCDIWTTSLSTTSYLGVTSHAFNKKARKLQSFILCKLIRKQSFTGSFLLIEIMYGALNTLILLREESSQKSPPFLAIFTADPPSPLKSDNFREDFGLLWDSKVEMINLNKPLHIIQWRP